MARRDRNPTGPNALIASARKIRLGTPGVRLDIGIRQTWQTEAWDYWRKIPEIKQLMLFLGNQLSKLRIYVAVDDPTDPEGDPIPITAEKSPVPPAVQVAALAELARLATHEGGLPELLRRYDLNLEIPGEGFLVGFGARAIGDPDPDPCTPIPDKPLTAALAEEWRMVSVSEVNVEGTGEYATTSILQHKGDQLGRLLHRDFDAIIRLYQPDPEWSALADSAMQGTLFECRVLMALTAQVLAVANSQMFAGFLTMPNELSFGAAAGTPNDDGTGAASEDPLETELDDVFSEVVEMPDSLMTVRPTVIRGPAQYLTPEYLRYIAVGRSADERLDEQITQRVRRIARGLNAPVEAVEGLEASTFANAKQVDRDLFDDHIEPRATGMVNSLTTGFLVPNLIDAATVEAPDGTVTIVDAELEEWAPQLYFWYDPASIIREPDTEAAADSAHDRGEISGAAYRKAKGFTDDDKPDALELIIRQGLRRGNLDPAITVAILQAVADEAGIELPDIADLTQPGVQPVSQMRIVGAAMLLREMRDRALLDPPGAAPIVLPAELTASRSAESFGPNPGARLLAIDTELRTMLLVAANDAIERALERVGNRLRSKVTAAHRPLIEGVPPRAFASVLGQGLVADAGVDLTADWSALHTQFESWVAGAQARALDELETIVGDIGDQRAELEARQDDDRAAAWVWLTAALTVLLAARLFDPSPDAPPVGEHDTSMTVPTGLIRAALARAGGAPDLGTDLGGAGAVLLDGGTRPAGGVGSGELIRSQLRDFGASIKAYRWVYGMSRRSTFPPHAALDGTIFTSYDDTRLTNGAGFPPFGFYLPGDHYGCRCDSELVIVPPAGLVPLV